MNRRQFFSRALAGIPLVAAPALLLEEISRPKIFLPPRGGWGGTTAYWTPSSKIVWSSDTVLRGTFMYRVAEDGTITQIGRFT